MPATAADLWPLLDDGTSEDADNAEDIVRLIEAESLGQRSLMRQSVEWGVTIYERTDTWVTPLMLAIRADRADVVASILGKGTSLSCLEVRTMDENETALLMGVKLCCSPAIVETLLASGANVMAADCHERLPLHLAATQADTLILRLLLAANSSVEHLNAVEIEGCTPLHLAADFNCAEAAELLILAGADLEIRDKGMWTPLAKAAYAGSTDAIQVLVSAGASLQATNSSGESILHWAIYSCDEASANSLLENGASVSCKDRAGWTPLLAVCDRKVNNNIIALLLTMLLDSGADIDVLAYDGLGILDIAYKSALDGTYVEDLLLANGASRVLLYR